MGKLATAIDKLNAVSDATIALLERHQLNMKGVSSSWSLFCRQQELFAEKLESVGLVKGTPEYEKKWQEGCKKLFDKAQKIVNATRTNQVNLFKQIDLLEAAIKNCEKILSTYDTKGKDTKAKKANRAVFLIRLSKDVLGTVKLIKRHDDYKT